MNVDVDVIVVAFAAAVLAAGCAPPAVRVVYVQGPGCGKDIDCKGDRICVATRCVEPGGAPASRRAVTARLRSPASGPASTPVPAQREASAGVAQFRGSPYHAGRAPGAIPDDAPRRLWTYATPAPVFSSPTVAPGGTIYFGGFDHQIHALSPDGRELWAFETGDLIWSTPAVLFGRAGAPDGLVLAGSDDDTLYALDARTGAIGWELTIGDCDPREGSGPEAARCDVDAGPTVGPDGTVYVGGDGVTALDPGPPLRIRWTFRTPAHVASTPAVDGRGVVYFGCQDHALYAVSPGGALRWRFAAGDDVDSSPAIGPDGTLYVGSDDHKLYAVDAAGALRWAVITGAEVESSPALAADGTLYAGSFDGRLYAVAPDGTVRWAVATGGKIRSSPVLGSNGRVLVGSEDHRLYALGPDGVVLWSLALGGDVDSSPTIAPDGTIYVGSDDGAMHAYR